tara:strand:- start:774 stop:1046 length:273 start_codon:yes stop_codon:yes gene_type:complete
LKLTQFREMPDTFGTANRVGPGGDESARMIPLNAAALADMSLDYQECRNISLMFFPLADVSWEAIRKAYVTLGVMVDRVRPSQSCHRSKD